MKPINLDLFAVPISIINLGEQSRLFKKCPICAGVMVSFCIRAIS